MIELSFAKDLVTCSMYFTDMAYPRAGIYPLVAGDQCPKRHTLPFSVEHSVIYHPLFTTPITSSNITRINSPIARDGLPILQDAILDHTSTNSRVSLQPIGSILDLERREGDLPSTSDTIGGDAEIRRVDDVIVDGEFVIASIVRFLPLQLGIGVHEPRAAEIGHEHADVLSEWARAGHRGAGELHPYGSRARVGIVRMRVEPHEVADPVRVRVTGEEDRVVDLVVVQVLQGAVAVGDIAVPLIVVKGIFWAKFGGSVDSGEDWIFFL